MTRTVLCHGCWDLIHLGHIRHLEEARSLGDRLVVSITADRHVSKGSGRPQFSAEQRREALLALKCVDEVIISESGTAAEIIRKTKPVLYVKGPDYQNSNDPGLLSEIEAVLEVGGQFHVTTSEKWSSTKLLRDVRLPHDTLEYLDQARGRNFLERIEVAIERADEKKILFVGEHIVDEYRYVKPLARPSKEFILATVEDGRESFDGGVVAASRHNDWKNVSHLRSVDHITKMRYVDKDFSRKLFETYSSRQIAPLDDFHNTVLQREVETADIVIALDFGHGFFGRTQKSIIQNAKFLALVSQTNAGNYGYNKVSNHVAADYICVDDQEARLATGMQYADHEALLAEIFRITYARTATITRGRYGSVSGMPFKSVPAFVQSGFDTMGAGDAFVAIAAPLVAVGLDIEMAAFAGNVAGGLKTSILGHRSHVTRDDLVKNLEWLLK